MKLVNLGPTASFSTYNLTTSSGNHFEDVSHAHIVSLMYKLITSSRWSDDLSIGFYRNRLREQQELTNNKKKNGNYHVRNTLRYVFGFAKHQEKVTYGLGYKLTLTGNKDDAVLNKDEAVADARIETDNIHWNVPHFTPSFPKQVILSIRVLSKTPTELLYKERSVFLKEIKNQNLWNCQLGSQKSMKVPIWIFVGFQQRDRQDSQILNYDNLQTTSY